MFWYLKARVDNIEESNKSQIYLTEKITPPPIYFLVQLVHRQNTGIQASQSVCHM